MKNYAPRIAFIGMPLTGKSTVAKVLSKKLGWVFMDSDLYIEKKINKSVHDIFLTDGEAVFRSYETEALKKAASYEHIVLATGGGIVELAGNRDLLVNSFTVIWLSCELNILMERYRSSATIRPLLADNPEASLQAIFNRRIDWYKACATMHFDTGSIAAEPLSEAIYNEYNNKA